MFTAHPLFRKLTARKGPAVHLREAVLVISLCVVYVAVRMLLGDGLKGAALENAENLIAFESAVGFFWEAGWNRWAVEMGDWLVAVFNWVYILTFMAVMPVAALALYIADRDRYFQYRAIILLSFFFALAAYAIFPVAPPRMMAEFGFVDTMKSFGPGWYDNRDAVAYFNSYAAMPSLHFSWSIIFGWLFFRQGFRLLKVLGVLYPTITLAAIIVTANHYLVDAASGVVMMVLAYWVYEAAFRSGRLSQLGQLALKQKVRLTTFTGRRQTVKWGG